VTAPASLRAGRDADAQGFIALIGACWAAYPGCVMDVDGEAPELRALSSYYVGHGGALWAAEAGGAIVGMVATRPLEGRNWEICRLYVDPASHGSGLASALIDAAEAHARACGGTVMKLWTDTRFDRAHRFYEKHSYVRHGAIRVLHDRSNSIEFAYAKPLASTVVWRLDAAGAASAEGRLAHVLKDCVEAGASVSFLPPLDLSAARAFWRRAASAVATGQLLLLAGWRDGALVGTVQLDLAMPPNQPHRGDLQKLLVSPQARRQGVARRLMQEVETAARAAGRTLLVLDTRAGDGGETLYRGLGWIEAGRIPGYAVNPDGTLCDTVLFYRRISG
jgi:ribosomal protein S18 acetylase RimI-like enzyme